MKMNWLGGLLLGSLALAGTAMGQDITNDVIFSVDMGVQIAATNFNPATMGVEVRGGFNGWVGGSALAREDTTSVYSATFSVTGPEGATNEYKFFGLPDPGGLEWESIGNRSFNLGTAGATQVLGTVYFNDEGPVGPEVTNTVTFSVDMGVQIAATNFNPATMGVEVRGGFNGWASGSVLAREDTTSVYSASFSVIGPEGGANEYKYFGLPDPGGLGWESIGNRSFNLGSAGTTQVLDTVYFNDEGPPQPTLTFTDGTWNPSIATNYTYTLERAGTVGDDIVLSSSATNVLTVPAGMSFDTGVNVMVFTAAVVDVSSGPATITASNASSGATAEYVVTPVAPALSFTDGTWDPVMSGNYTYTLMRTGMVSDAIILSSSDTNVLTVPSGMDFDPAASTLIFTAAVVDVSSGPATITASNASSGATAEYVVTPVPPTLSFTDGTYDPATTGAYTYTLMRTGMVYDTIALTSSDTNVLTVPSSMDFGASDSVMIITASVVSVSSGPATIIATNMMSGAWAEYVVTPAATQPAIGPIVFDVGTGNISFTVPAGYTLFSVEGADTELVAGAWAWDLLIDPDDYTVAGDQVTILTSVVSREVIRIWVTPI